MNPGGRPWHKLAGGVVAYLALAPWSGMPSEISRSNLPALRSAGSSESGLFVAPITNTCASGLLFKSTTNRECDATDSEKRNVAKQ